MNSFLFVELTETDYLKSLLKGNLAFSRLSPGNSQDFFKSVRPGRVKAVWENDVSPVGSPNIIIAESSTLRSLLGRLIALPNGVSPFTSVIRAWDLEDLKLIPLQSAPSMSPLLAAAFTGMIIGELTRAVGKGIDFRLVGLDVVKRTLAFTCAQAAGRGYIGSAFATATSRWLEVSKLTRNDRTTPSAFVIARLSAFVVEACSDGKGQMSPLELAYRIDAWSNEDRDLLGARPMSSKLDLEELVRTLQGKSREQRVDLIEAALTHIKDQTSDGHLESGFLISLIDPGSQEFIEFARRYDDGNGGVMLAYTTCAALISGESALSKYRGFGASLYLKGFGPKATTESDISFAEVSILLNTSRDASIDFRTRASSSIEVELMPWVSGSFFNNARQNKNHPTNVSEVMKSEELQAHVDKVKKALDFVYLTLNDMTNSQVPPSSRDRRYKR